jgi:PA-IL-like protein
MSSLRRPAWVAVLLLALAVTAVSAGPLVSVVLKNGQRFSGVLVAQRSDRVFVEIDNRQYSWSQDEIAAIEFAPGRANRRELSALSSVPSQFEGGPAATLALQDGQLITGRFGGIQSDGRAVRIFTSGRNRSDVNSSDIARLYLDAATARNLYASNAVVDTYPQAARPAFSSAAPAGPFAVDARQEWTRTGVTVRQGERISFESSGQVRWGSGQGQIAGPDGADIQTSERRNYPVPQWGVGALVARVGNGRPFAIGSSTDPIVMPADGELYLGVNDSGRGDNSGSFSVRIRRGGRSRAEGYGAGQVDFTSATQVRVDARQEWTPTSVTVRQGERLAFQTTGQIAWGRATGQVTGPEGAYVEDSVRRNYPVPSAGVGALVGRVEDGPPFLVGAGSEPIVMPGDGQLYLGVNDSSRGDNSGTFFVRIARPGGYMGRPGGVYGQDRAGFGTAVQVSVDARQDWTPTNVTVRQGERIAFQATGQIVWGRGANQVAGPAGAEVETFSRWAYPVPSAGVGALVARIDDGAPFLVGAGTEPIAMPADGQLYLGVNDSSRGDNNGSFIVRIARSTTYYGAPGAGYGQDQIDFASATPVRVDAREAWTETDVMVRRGERIAFQATGQIAWGRGATQVTGPDGAPVQAAGRRNYAVPSAGVGAVVGRIGEGPPFLVGAGTDPIVMPADGRLYLGINDSGRGNNSGFFLVRVARVGRR